MLCYPAMATQDPLPAACAESLDRHLRPELFRALGDANRLTLLGRLALAQEPMTVTEASSCCGVHLSGVSRHLGVLRDAGIVRAEKLGREVRYHVDCAVLTEALRGLADAIEDCRAACCAAPKKGCC